MQRSLLGPLAFLGLFLGGGVLGASNAGCNVRNSAGCQGASSEDSAPDFRFNMLSYTVDGAYQWIYDWGPYDMLVSSELLNGGLSTADLLTLRFTAVNEYEVAYARGGDSTVSLSSSSLSTAATGTPQDLAAESRMLTLLQEATTVSLEDRRLTVAGPKYAAYFDRLPLTEPIVGQEWDGLALEGKVLKVVPATYFFRGEFAALFGDVPEFPINVEVAMDAEDEVLVVLRYVDIATFRVKYNVADGWVETVVPVGTISNGASSEQLAVGKKVVDIVANLQQIAFENGNLLQFITDSGATRVSFAYEASRRRLAASLDNVRYVQPESYTLKGVSAALYTDAAKPAALRIEYPDAAVGFVNVTLIGGQTQSFAVHYNNADGWVSSVTVGRTVETSPAPASLDAAAEKKLRDILGNVQQIAFEADGRVQFITDSGSTRVSFVQSAGRKLEGTSAGSSESSLVLVPETYMVNSQFGSLFSGTTPFDVTATITQNAVGNATVVVRAINSITFTYSYNNADGWVEQITPGMVTRLGGDSEKLAVEQRLIDILSTTNQLAFESDGRVQFIAAYGANRVAFDPASTTTTTSTASTTSTATVAPATLPATTSGALAIVASSYTLNGALVNLYDGDVFPITATVTVTGVGSAVIVLYAMDTTQYTVGYNNADGWVSSVSSLELGTATKTTAQQTTAMKIRNIMANLQQIAFEADGSVQFISTGGTSRVLFATSSRRRRRRLAATDGSSASSSSLGVLPETYQKDGAAAVLFSGDAFPVSLTVESTGVGAATVTLAGVNTHVYDVRYNNADGWVNSIRSTSSTSSNAVSTSHQQSMDRIVSAVANAQQIAFESDGTVQFLSNHGADRLSFSPSATAAVESRTLLPSSYVLRGAAASLFEGGSAIPVTLTTKQPAVGVLQANLTAVNTVQYDIEYNNADGWVSKVTHKQVGTGTGSAVALAAEQKLANILANVQQLGFNNNLQFITDSGQSRVAFGAERRRRLADATRLTAVPESYQVGGKSATLYGSAAYFPITYEAVASGVGSLDFAISAVNDFKYSAKYNNADGWVSSVEQTSSTRRTGTDAQMAAEARVTALLGALQQIAFEDDGSVQFIAGADRLLFTQESASPALRVVSSTYQLNGVAGTLFSGSEFPVTLEMVSTGTGAVNATLHAVNVVRYRINYNNADGWVSSVSHSRESGGESGTTEQLATETKLENLLANVQQLAFESDGSVQIITDDGKSRVTFAPANGSRRLQAVQTRTVAAETYTVNGVAAQLYTAGVAYPAYVSTASVAVGSLDVTLTVVNSYNYRFRYNNADGWVSSITPGFATNVLASVAQADVESRLVAIVSGAQQLSFESDGRLQFIGNGGRDRVAFDLVDGTLTGASASASDPRYVVPSSYVFRGAAANLFTAESFPITLDEVTASVGDMNVTLTAVDTIVYRIQFDNSNGAVRSISHSSVASGSGTAAQVAAETKLKNIVANVQQVAYGTDGSLTFITDNGATSITFAYSSRRRLQETGRLLDLLPSSYKLRGEPAELLSNGTTYPISIGVTPNHDEDGEQLLVLLRAPGADAVKFTLQYDSTDGVVSSVEQTAVDAASVDTDEALTETGEEAKSATEAEAALLQTVVELISSTKIVRVDVDDSVTFTTADGSELAFSAVTHIPRVRRDVIAESYELNGEVAELFSGETFPIAVETYAPNDGELDLLLRAANVIQYRVTYNETDGWIMEIVQLAAPVEEEKKEKKEEPSASEKSTDDGDNDDDAERKLREEVEKKVRAVIERAQQVEFTDDGTLAFSGDSGATKLSFGLPSAVPVSRVVVPGSYTKDGAAAELFSGDEFEVAVQTLSTEEGVVVVNLNARNTFVYTYQVDAAGKVLDVSSGLSTLMAVADAETVTAISSLVGGAEELIFAADGELTFVANGGKDRLTFALPARRRLNSANQVLEVLPETYSVGGSYSNLYEGGTFPITAKIESLGVGQVAVIVDALSVTKYVVKYNNADGWVSSILGSILVDRTYSALPDQIASEGNVLAVIESLSQIAFESDGTVQFIANNGNERLSFGVSKAQLLEVAPSSYQTNGVAATLFEGDSFPVSIVLSNDDAGRANVTFNAVSKIVYTIGYNVNDGWVSSVTHNVLGNEWKATEDHKATETKLVNILANVQQLAFESDGRVQFITDSGASRISFTPAAVTSARRMLLALATVEYSLDSSSYLQNGASQSLFEGTAEYPMTLKYLAETESERLQLTAVGVWTFTVRRDRDSGVVSSIAVESTNAATGTDAQVAAETRVRNILANAQLIMISSSSISVLTDNYASRVTFRSTADLAAVRPTLVTGAGVATTRPAVGAISVGSTAIGATTRPAVVGLTDEVSTGTSSSSVTVSLDGSTFVSNGTYASFYTGESFPIALTLTAANLTSVTAELSAVNQYVFGLTWNALGGKVSESRLVSYTDYSTATATQAADLAKAVYLLEHLEALTFSPQGAVVLSADNLTSRVMFRGSQGRRLQTATVGQKPHTVAAETYQVDGKSATLVPAGYSGANATVELESRGVGIVRVTLSSNNDFVYDITYNNADGWVSGISPVSQTRRGVTTDQQTVDTRLTAIVGNTQQIAFESDGRVQFIADNGATRVAFDEGDAILAVQGNFVAPTSYTLDGTVTPLYVGTTFPISLAVVNDEIAGTLNLTLSAVNVRQFSLNYNTADGWITGRVANTPGSLIGAVDSTWTSTEARVVAVLNSAEQVVFESDGRLTFTAASGATRLTFDKSSSARRLSTTRLAVAGSYQRDGATAKLYDGAFFPIALDYVQTGVGAATLTLRALPGTRSYDVRYNNADGWVSSVTLVNTAVGNVSTAQQAAFDRVVDLLGRVQQLGFNDDNRLQLITDNGNSRITFN